MGMREFLLGSGLAREGGVVDCELLHTLWKNIKLD